ncbi:hypothetical protein ACFL7D_01770 [candidate division KSB1 bacterium]
MGDKEAVKNEVKALLLEGDLKSASSKILDNSISIFETNKIAEKVFQTLLAEKKIQYAIDVCDHFNLPNESKINAISSQFHSLVAEKKFEEAFDWGTKYSMSPNDINANSVKAFEFALKNKEVRKALQYVEKFNPPLDLLTNIARNYFNVLFDGQNYIDAFYIGQKFELASKRTLTAALRGISHLLSENKFKLIVQLEESFRVLHDRKIDEIDDEDKKAFTKKYGDIVDLNFIQSNKINELGKFVNSLNLFKDYEGNGVLTEMIMITKRGTASVHEVMINEGRGPAAFDVVKNFQLLDNNTPEDIKLEVISSAENAHNEMMINKNLKAAMFLKENYELFTKNVLENSREKLKKISNEFLMSALLNSDLENAKTVIKKYEIDVEIVKITVGKAIQKLIDGDQYPSSFEILRSFNIKITDPDVLTDVMLKFHKAYEDNEMKVASDLAFYFHLKDPRVLRAASNHWESLMELRKYEEALSFKKERRIPKKLIEPIVKRIYEKMMGESNITTAAKLRMDYKVNVNVWKWIIEKIKSMLGR